MDFIKLVIVIAVAFTSIATVLNWSELEPLQLIYIKKNQIVIWFFFYYSRSFLFGVLVGSLAKNPKRNIPTKKKTMV